MSAHDQTLVSLHRHPDTPCTAVESIKSFLRWHKGPVLTVNYVLSGNVELLRIPPYRSAQRGDGLWRHTCCEAFIGAKDDFEYYEFNFSPSGEWAAYSFRDYRDGGPYNGDGLEPKINVERGAASLELSAVIRLDHLPGLQPDVCFRIALSTVIEDLDGSLSYWALKHPPGKPDFHHFDNFVLEFEPKVVDGAAVDYTIQP